MFRIETRSIAIETEEFKQLEQLARKDGLSTSYLVRKAIREYLKTHTEQSNG